MLLSLCTAVGQGFIQGELTYNSFDMRSLKELQQSVLSSSQQANIPLSIVSSFPSYPGYSVSGGWIWNRIAIGISLGYTSTGGRLDYEDYSGYARADQLLRCFSSGSFFQYKLNKNNKWAINVKVNAGTVFSYFTEKETLVVGSSANSNSLNANSLNIYLRPGIFLRRNLGRSFIEGGAAYEFQIHGNLYRDDNPRATIQANNQNVRAEWDGLRLSIGYGIVLGKR